MNPSLLYYSLIVLLLSINYSKCCLATYSEEALLRRPETAREVAKYLKTFGSEASFRNFVNISKYNNEYYSSHKKSLPNGEELFSDFDAPHCCCWGSENAQSLPSDEAKPGLEWRIAKITSQSLLQSRSINSSLPRGKFLFATPSRPVSPKDTATFVSCEIKCTDQPVIVTLKHWLSPDVVVRICKKTFDSLERCQYVPNRLMPGPTTFEISGGQRFKLAIEASNFTEGAFAAVDDITASAKPCQKREAVEKAVDALFSSTNYDACRKITCDFEEGICNYQTLPVDEQLTSTILTSGQIGNRVNGVPGPANGRTYVGALLKPNQRFFMSATNLNLDDDAVLRFDVLERTEGVQVAVCFDGTDCPYTSNFGLKATDNSWNEISLPVPIKTKTVSFLASNDGANTGAIGLDNIRLLIPKGKFPEDAVDSYC